MKKLSILVSTLLLGFGLSVSAQNTIFINEFSAGGATQYDGKDWVELYNPSNEEVSLTDYTLDDAGSETKATTATLSGTIPAKGFKVLIEGVDFSYGLGASEETLILKLNGTVVDQITYNPDIKDKTLGRVSDGAGSNDVIFTEGVTGGWKMYDEADATIGASNNIFTVVYTSDQHYGITRSNFRGASDVDATIVNAAMVAQINKMNATSLPTDGGVGAGTLINISNIITTGDISNRAESGIAKSAVTLTQFDNDYNNITLQNFKGEKPALFLLPGNHDVSNAIGQAKIPAENVDVTTMTAIYNRMMQPATPKTTATYNYATDKINYVRTIGGIQFVFINMWPDHTQRAWITANTNPALPIFIFTHDEPDVETKHLIDPDWTPGTPLDFNNKFEYLVNEVASNPTTDVERDEVAQRAFANFIAAFPNIKAYFHGNTNFTEFYDYKGPDGNINLPTFRIDSPMKGEISGDDETKLSFQIITIDRATQEMTVREVLWNTTQDNTAPIVFGETKTIVGLNQIQPSYGVENYTVPSWTLFQRTIIAGSPDESVLVSKNAPYNVNTAINTNPTTQMGITWYTNVGVTGTKLQLIEGTSGDFSSPLKEINATETVLSDVMYVTSGNNNNDLIEKTGFEKGETRSYISNKVLVEDLTPNTTYSYRVGGIDDTWSEVYTFTTAKDNKDEFEFIYITDTQSNTDEMFEISRKTMATAQTNVPDAKFVLMTGDLVETSGNSNSEWEWEQWFETMKKSWQNLPIAPAQGNHDTSEKYSNWFNHFNTSKAFNAAQTDNAAKTAMEGTNYSFVYGDALFMILTWEDYKKDETYFAAVEDWMKAQIAANPDVKWKIAAFHKNMFTGSKSHQSDADGKIVRERMAPAFQDMGIDLVFEGHDHVYEVMGVMVAGKDADGKNIYSQVEGAVTNQTFETPSTLEENNPDMTGIHGGTFNVNEGVLYFLNNSAGKKKYQSRTEEEMIAAESAHAVPDYYQFFHRFGQTGEPTFSKVTVSTEAIRIATYTVNDEGAATEFDAFEVVKNHGTAGITPLASINSISVYPDPASESITIITNETVETIRIVSMAGQVIVSQSGGNTVDVSNVNNGVYVLSVKTDKGVYTQQLVVKK
ncbi:MAG: metallophosphoesterase [Bacteroidales bacterium]|jgi:hypothetical protein|nr:metallophosphoesterase [Bacteroidales bacterium]